MLLDLAFDAPTAAPLALREVSDGQQVTPPMLPDILGGLALDHAAAVWVEDGARPRHATAAFVTSPRRVRLRLPPQVLFIEDFEGGLAGWSVQSEGPVGWLLAEVGECGATSRMTAFNEAATCSFTPGMPTVSRHVSPSFALNDVSPFTVEFDLVRDFAAGSLSTIRVEVVDETATDPLVTQQVANHQLATEGGARAWCMCGCRCRSRASSMGGRSTWSSWAARRSRRSRRDLAFRGFSSGLGHDGDGCREVVSNST